MQEEKDIYHKCRHLDTAGTILETPERKEKHIREKENYNIYLWHHPQISHCLEALQRQQYTHITEMEALSLIAFSCRAG